MAMANLMSIMIILRIWLLEFFDYIRRIHIIETVSDFFSFYKFRVIYFAF